MFFLTDAKTRIRIFSDTNPYEYRLTTTITVGLPSVPLNAGWLTVLDGGGAPLKEAGGGAWKAGKRVDTSREP